MPESIKMVVYSVLYGIRFESGPDYNIVVWCNGNTTDFDSVIFGSNPGATSNVKITEQYVCLGVDVQCYAVLCRLTE